MLGIKSPQGLFHERFPLLSQRLFVEHDNTVRSLLATRLCGFRRWFCGRGLFCGRLLGFLLRLVLYRGRVLVAVVNEPRDLTTDRRFFRLGLARLHLMVVERRTGIFNRWLWRWL